MKFNKLFAHVHINKQYDKKNNTKGGKFILTIDLHHKVKEREFPCFFFFD